MGSFLKAVPLILPIAVKLAQRGELLQLVAAVVEIIKMLEPLLKDPATAEKLEATVSGLTLLVQSGAAQPDNPAMARASGH